MNIGVPSETVTDEARVALIPPVTQKLVDAGHNVFIAAGAGVGSDWSDATYRDAGCTILDDRTEVFEQSDVVLQVRGLGANPDGERDPYHEEQLVIGLLGPYALTDDDREFLTDRRITAFALELVPRTGRAQSMDVLTSMASLGGYKAIILAANAFQALFPLQMTAAGTIRPADVFVVGAGVAGLQAIATAKRLGAKVRAYDIRPAVKEEVESLGAEFVELELPTDETATKEGYARAQNEEFYRKQRAMMTRVIETTDVLITSAAVPGRTAPTLVTEEMIEGMDAGSVIIDLAADGGGNCAPTQRDETIEYADVTIFGPTNLPSTVSHTASQLFANNIYHFLQNLLDNSELNIDTTDDIINATLLSHEGKIHTDPQQPTDREQRDRGPME